MANKVRSVAILTLALLATVGLLQIAMFGARSKSSITMTTQKTETGGQEKEMAAVNKYHEIKNEAAVTYTYLHEQAPHKDSGYRRLGSLGQSEGQNGGSGVLGSGETGSGSNISNSDRGIPGGPDSQHHGR